MSKQKLNKVKTKKKVKEFSEGFRCDIMARCQDACWSSKDLDQIQRLFETYIAELLKEMFDMSHKDRSVLREFTEMDTEDVFKGYYSENCDTIYDISKLSKVMDRLVHDFTVNNIDGFKTDLNPSKVIKDLHSTIEVFYNKFRLDTIDTRTCIACEQDFLSRGSWDRRCHDCTLKGIPSEEEGEYTVWKEKDSEL